MTSRLLLVTLLAALSPALARAELFPPPGPGPLSAPPAGIRVEITLPAGVELLPGSAALSVETGSDSARIGLSDLSPPAPVQGGARHTLGPNRLGAAALSGLQARNAGTGGPQATMSVSMELCRRTKAPAAQPFALTLRLAPGAPGLPLAAPGAGLSVLTGSPPAALAPCR